MKEWLQTAFYLAMVILAISKSTEQYDARTGLINALSSLFSLLKILNEIFILTGLGIRTAPGLDVVKAISAKAKSCSSHSSLSNREW
jgi:hypothetical protein